MLVLIAEVGGQRGGSGNAAGVDCVPLDKRVYGQDFRRGENALRSFRSGPLAYVNQPVNGLVSDVSQISLQHGAELYVKQGCVGSQDRRIPDSDPLDTGKPGSIPPLDEICGFSGPE